MPISSPPGGNLYATDRQSKRLFSHTVRVLISAVINLDNLAWQSVRNGIRAQFYITQLLFWWQRCWVPDNLSLLCWRCSLRNVPPAKCLITRLYIQQALAEYIISRAARHSDYSKLKTLLYIYIYIFYVHILQVGVNT